MALRPVRAPGVAGQDHPGRSSRLARVCHGRRHGFSGQFPHMAGPARPASTGHENRLDRPPFLSLCGGCTGIVILSFSQKAQKQEFELRSRLFLRCVTSRILTFYEFIKFRSAAIFMSKCRVIENQLASVNSFLRFDRFAGRHDHPSWGVLAGRQVLHRKEGKTE